MSDEAQDMVNGGQVALSPIEEQILETVRRHPDGIRFEDLCAETLMSPDLAMRAVAVLLQEGRIGVDTEVPESELQLVGRA